MAAVDSEKLRSRNSDSGTRGSTRTRLCHQMKIPSTTTPNPMSRGTEMKPVMVPQSYVSPSWMPNTRQNIPTEDRATPTRSNEWLCVSSRGTNRAASTNPTTPTGTLMKKIHCHPGPSTSRPPSSGPTSVATPAVAPQSDIA
jgi:hypothetical protein